MSVVHQSRKERKKQFLQPRERFPLSTPGLRTTSQQESRLQKFLLWDETENILFISGRTITYCVCESYICVLKIPLFE